MILFSRNNPSNIDAYILNNENGAMPVQMLRLPQRIELEQIVLTHQWQLEAADFGGGSGELNFSALASKATFAKNFQSLYDLYRQRVGTTGLTFEQWLAVLPGIGAGQGPVDYVGLYMCEDAKHWLVTVTKAKLHLTEITESIVIKNYVVLPLREVIAGARQRAEQRLALIESFGQRLNDGEFLGDISWRGDQKIDMETFITEYLFKE